MKILSKDLLFSNENKVISSDISTAVSLDRSFTDALFYNGVFRGLSTSFSGYNLYTSSDGESYSLESSGNVNGRWGCLCPDYTDGGVICMFLTDETNARIVCTNGYITRYISNFIRVKQCIYVNGLYYLIGNQYGYTGGRILIGSDLSSWQEPIKLSDSINGIAYGNGIFVICADSGVYVSFDGLNFTKYATPIICNKIIFADGYFIIAGSGGIIRSKNGIDWEQIYTDSTIFYALAYGNKKLVAGGSKIISTIDFKHFKTVKTLGRMQSVDTITYGNDVFDITASNPPSYSLYYMSWGIE